MGSCTTNLYGCFVLGNASGQLAPPMIMYAYERIPKHIVLQVPHGWGIGKSESGWMTSESFYEYISNIFYPWLIAQSIEFPVVLYLDGHKSHVTMPLTEFCREKAIILISLPPNSTHVMQPLDVGFFKPLKSSWKNAINKFKTENNNKTLNKENFAPVLEQAFKAMPNLERIFKNSFRASGLFPFDPSNVDYNKLILTNEKKEENAVIQTENADIVKHLRFLETNIEPNLLSEFYSRQGDVWNRKDENAGLYQTWLKIFQSSGLSFRKKENPSVIIEIEDGLILEEGWENLLTLEGLANEDHIPINDSNILKNKFDCEETESVRNLVEEVKEGAEKFELKSSKVGSLSNIEECEKDDNNANLNNNVASEKEMQRPVETNEQAVEQHKITDILIELTETETELKERSAKESVVYTKTYLTPEKVRPLEENIKTSENKPKENIENSNNYNKDLPENIKTPETKNNENILPGSLEKKTIDECIENSNNDNKDLPENIKIPEQSNNCKNVLPGITVPSPFKASLFWPGPSNVKKTKRKLSDKIPSVGTSDEWRQYYLKKENEKKRIEQEKEERKRKREEKVRHVERPNKRVKKGLQTNQNKGNNIPLTEKDLRNKNKLSKTDININDYVIINYLNEYYPGKIVQIKNGKYLVNTMTRSGLNKWKWPTVKDEIFYEFEEILQKIEAPLEINKRGFFEIKDFEEYQKFLLN